MIIWAPDPFRPWPRARPWIWAFLAAWVMVFQGPAWLRSLRPQDATGVDFFQEWASARNLLEGLPVYMDLKEQIERHLQVGPVEVIVDINAHPPTSILMTVPFAWLSYPDAVLVWNLISLAAMIASGWIVVHTLGIQAPAWSIFPVITLLLLCNPLKQQIYLAQFNLILLLMIVGIWLFERGESFGCAGLLLGAATAIKIFPGFLFVYFILRRQWKIVGCGFLTLIALTAITASIMGIDTYRKYFQDVLPRVERCQSGWTNASLNGWWKKLFDPATIEEKVEPLWRSPLLVRAGWLLSSIAVVAILTLAIRQARSRFDDDRTFGLAITAMLLVSPIAWDHYFLLLFLPLVLLVVDMPASTIFRAFFVLDIAILWLDPENLYDWFIVGGHQKGVSTPWLTLAVVSIPCYALVGLYMLEVLGFARNGTESALP